MKNQMMDRGRINIGKYFFIFFMQFYSCNGDKEKIIELVVVNEMQHCSENNIFYKIVFSGDSEFLMSERDSIVLLSFVDSIATERNYQLFFPAFPDQRYEFQIRGYFLKEKVGVDYAYGCPGSQKFTITEILKLRMLLMKSILK